MLQKNRAPRMATLEEDLWGEISGVGYLEPHPMENIVNSPLLMFVLCLVTMWLSAKIGDLFRKKLHPVEDDERNDLSVVLAATLTLLGLIIGFSFSMAINRYDMRKNYEEEEANAIGTECARAELLPAADAAKVRSLLKDYLDQRVLFYLNRDEDKVRQINAATAQLQSQLWSAVKAPAAANPSPLTALVVSGMNDVLNSQGYTQAAYWNRIPIAAWVLMWAIAICCNLLIGYSARRTGAFLFLILPIAVSISFFLISDLDAPQGGVIRVHPQNLESVVQSLSGR